MRIILLGPPGSGKGTQAVTLTSLLDIPAISTGNMLRSEMSKCSEVGKKAEGYVNAGQLVPDSLILEMIENRLSNEDCKKGYVLDGFPRNVPQAEALDAKGIEIDAVLMMDVSDATIVRRMTGRRVCRGCDASYHIDANPPEKDGVCDKCSGELIIRKDDDEQTVVKRLKTYHENTEPLLEYYGKRGLLKRVVGCEKVEDTKTNLIKAVESIGR